MGRRPAPSFLVAHGLHPLSLTNILAMETKPQQPSGRGDARSSLNGAINALDLLGSTPVAAKPVKDAFDSVCVLLGTIRVGFLVARYRLQLPA